MTKILPVFISILLLLISSCGPTPVPKPRAFFRIDLPEKEYILFDSGFPYSFEYPVYAEINKDLSPMADPWWLNLDMPPFKARIHISYKAIDNNLGEYLDDVHQLLHKHIPKASGIREDVVIDNDERVFGTIYSIRGPGVASACQFYLTDSTKHFLRGALYFHVIPNNDSLAPVIDFIKEDIHHLASTLRWK